MRNYINESKLEASKLGNRYRIKEENERCYKCGGELERLTSHEEAKLSCTVGDINCEHITLNPLEGYKLPEGFKEDEEVEVRFRRN